MENRFHDQDQGNRKDWNGETLGELYGISHVPSTFGHFGGKWAGKEASGPTGPFTV